MHVAVLGAGVIGVTSAWYLAQAGHEVTVVDRHAQAGEETSFANGGRNSVSRAPPWGEPRAPREIPRLRWPGGPPPPFPLRGAPRPCGRGLPVPSRATRTSSPRSWRDSR